MKIGVDAGCLGIKDERLKVGVYTVVKNLLIELSKLDKKNEYLLYSFYPIEKTLLKKLESNMKNIVLPSMGWLKIILPIRLLLDRPDVFIAANQALPVRLPFSNYKTLGIFYDIAFEKYPQLYSYAASIRKHSNNSKHLAENADKIIAISKNTKKDVQAYYDVPNAQIEVAYPGVDVFNAVGKYKNKNPFFLFVGAFKKSKNIPFLLQAFDAFSETVKKEYDLFLVGGDKWLDPDIKHMFSLVSGNAKKHIKQLNFVDEEKLKSLYKGAIAFVSPSLYEGFGLPFLEAQSLGCPVIGSTRGSLPEIIGQSGILVDPTSATELTDALRQIVEGQGKREKYIKQGLKNAKKYSWKIFAKKVQSALQTL